MECDSLTERLPVGQSRPSDESETSDARRIPAGRDHCAHFAHFALYDVCVVSDISLSRRPLTASERDQGLFAMVPELDVLRGAERLGLNVYVGGGPGSGKTTLLRRIAYEYPRAAVFARANSAESASGLLDAIAEALRAPLAMRYPATDTELDVRRLEAVLSATLDDWQDEEQRPRVVLVDGASDEQIRVLFGRYRDTMWDLPLTWIVAGGRSAAPPPSDAFFDRVVRLAPWPRERVRKLIELRVPQWPARSCDEVASILAPATPTRALLDLQALVLTGDRPELLQSFADERAQASRLPGRLRDLYEVLNQSGPTHAGDEWLLEALGVSRSRIVHGLQELKSLGLVRAERDGRRVCYTTRLHSLFSGVLGPEAAGRVAADPTVAAALVESFELLVDESERPQAQAR